MAAEGWRWKDDQVEFFIAFKRKERGRNVDKQWRWTGEGVDMQTGATLHVHASSPSDNSSHAGGPLVNSAKTQQ